MTAGPGWVPSPDPESVASLVEDGLEHLPTDVLASGPDALMTAEPTTLVLGTVIGTVAKAEISEYSRKLDHRLSQYVDEHDNEEAVAVKVAAGLSRLLPDGEELNQAARQAARGDADALRAQLEAYHENEQRRAALDRAVEQILTGDFEDIEATLTDVFDTRDTDAARALLFDFMELVRTRQTQQTLEAVLALDGRFDEFVEDLDAMRQDLEHNIEQSLIEADLRSDGFRRLSPLAFDREIEDPERPWRAGFDFVHVREDFAVDRHRLDGTNVVDDLFDSVRAGTTLLVRGPAGSGKSTICKSVACRWYDTQETGPVFYRESGRGSAFKSVGQLKTAIRGSPGHVLVVVEDAVRPATDDIYDLIDQLRGTDVAVSFLLDARRAEHEDFEDPAGMETGAEDALREVLGSIERYDVPGFDPDDTTEVQRIVERFEAKTGREVPHSPAYIHDEIISTDAELGEMVYLTYFLPVGGEKAVGLEGDVRAKYETLLEPASDESQRTDLTQFDDDLRRDVGLLVNLLNASRIGVYPELVHALGQVHGNDRETHREIQDIREALGGWMLYPQTVEGSPIEQTTHELWSALYLRRVAERYDDHGSEGFERGSKERFEDCVNALFNLCEDDAQRLRISRGVENTEVLERIADDPTEEAENFVRNVFEMGEEWPILASLYGVSEASNIEIPAICSEEAVRDMSLSRGRMYREGGFYEAAHTEFREARGLSEELDDRSGIATSLGNIGLVARRQGDFEAAREYHEDSLDISEDLDDQSGIAKSLNSLGAVAHEQGDFETARGYYEDSLAIREELGDRSGIATCLNNLGLVAQEQSDFEAAQEYHEDSLAIREELGDRSDIAASLNSLGWVARRQGDFEAAQEYHEDSLDISEELGDRSGIAASLNSLGAVAHGQSDFEAARGYYEESLAIREELGDRPGIATSRFNLGLVAQAQGDFEAAQEQYEDSLAISEELGDNSGIAASLSSLGAIAHEQGDLEAARGCYERSASIVVDIGAPKRAVTVLENLVKICNKLDREEEAQKWCDTAIELIENTDTPDIETEAQWFRSQR